MTRSFNTISETREYFKDYNFNNWLINTFEINFDLDSIKKMYLLIEAGLVSINIVDKYGYNNPVGSYGIEDHIDLINIIKEIVYEPYM